MPLLVVLAGMLSLGWNASKAGAAGWVTAMGVAATAYCLNLSNLAIANAKGMSLAVFIITIIWGASLLYNIVRGGGGVRVISRGVSLLGGTPVAEALILAWCFTGVMQGIGGFGVPVVVISPILAERGFPPLAAVTATLLGHSWSINFGSMATSYWAIQLVTGLPKTALAHQSAVMAVVPILLTGLGVAYIAGGRRGLLENTVVVVVTGSAMALTQWAVVTNGVPEGGAIISGAVGCLTVFLLSNLCAPRGWRRGAGPQAVDGCAAAEACALPAAPWWVTLAPYLAMVVMLVMAQVPAVKTGLKSFGWGLSYPGYTTPLGLVVKPEVRYSWIGLVSHPAPVLLIATALGVAIYRACGLMTPDAIRQAWNDSLRQCLPAALSTAFLVMMALIMNDSGMTTDLAVAFAWLSGRFFPVISPLLGGLGSFLSGSNASSNVLFGKFQVETARALGMDPVVLAAAQTVGGSVGSLVAPSKIVLGAATVGLEGCEGRLMRDALLYSVPVIVATGVLCMIIASRTVVVR